MKGSEVKLLSYMQGTDKRFVIPVYQRNYDWRLENCRQLFDDLVKIIRQDRQSHFFGSIVSVHSDGEYNEFQIIDGQQRLTTISLLFLAMCHLMDDGEMIPKEKRLAEKILKTYLINEFKEGEDRIKLRPIKNDEKAFAALFNNPEEGLPDSNLTINYKFFCTEIKKGQITIDELFEAVKRLEIINITLNHEDNPQLIFESLNSTGLALSEGDKIRNFILMGLPVQEQNTCYENYWNKIEILTHYDVSAFIRDYLSIKQQSIPAISKVYLKFKSYVEEKEICTQELLKDMLEYARRYHILLDGKTKDSALNACILRLNRLETTVTRPFFLEVLRMQENQVITLEQVKEIFLYTENYLFRRSISNLARNLLNQQFMRLHKDIIRLDGTSDNYTEKFKFILLSKNGQAKFPRDEEFIQNLSICPIYLIKSKNKIYIFERLENAGTLEDKDIYRHCDEGIYSIEHIMPKKLTKKWERDLGKDYEKIHEQWLDRLANLTLTAYNSRYSNDTFEQKRDMKNGFWESGLRMNVWIAKQNQWTLSELEARNKLLMAKALEIWPLPETDYHPQEKQLESCTLEDHLDLSGRGILRFEYKNKPYTVKNWTDMQKKVMQILHKQDRSILLRQIYKNEPDSGLNAYISYTQEHLRKPLLLDTDIYLESNTATNSKITFLRRIFKLYEANPEDLVFYLKENSR